MKERIFTKELVTNAFNKAFEGKKLQDGDIQNHVNQSDRELLQNYFKGDKRTISLFNLDDRDREMLNFIKNRFAK